MPTTHEILYEVAVASLMREQARLEEMRSRAGILLGGESFAIGLLLNAAATCTGTSRCQLSFLTVLGVIGVAASLLSIVLILAPQTNAWIFTAEISELTVRPEESPEALYEHLLTEMADWSKRNTTGLNGIYRMFRIALWSLFGGLIALLFEATRSVL